MNWPSDRKTTGEDKMALMPCCIFNKGSLCKAGRIVLQILLLVIFLYFFGLPALKRYQRKEVTVVRSEKDVGGILVPAVTIASRNPQTQRGWRAADAVSSIEGACGGFNGTIDQCIEEKTFEQSETFVDVLVGSSNSLSLLNMTDSLTTEFASTSEGRYYTINVTKKVGPNDQMYIALKYGFIHQIYIHDPNYFILSYNPSLGHIMRIVNPNTSFNHYYNLIMTEVEELDLPDDPCNLEPSYSFQACIKESLSSQVGCRTKWDRWSPKNVSMCTTMEQYK